jgi:UDP-N-acetylmuramoyl-L-alanyl-D-glutamate--2,6-diaminopimelate ligase
MNPRKLVKKLVPTRLFMAVEPYGHLAESVVYNTLNGFPGRGFKVIGVTGTNGKTTTAFMIHRMLHESGYKVGLMSTVAWGPGDDIRSQMQHYTNVPVPQLMERLKVMRDAGVEWIVLETTSQALNQRRTWGVPYSVAVLTNLTHDHLTYHRTFERYRDAKRRLFKLANKNKKGLRTGVINADDPNAEYFASDIANTVMYGVDKGGLKATNVKLSPAGVQYEVKAGGETYKIRTRLPGSFNVYNSLAAVGVGRVVGLSRQQIEQGIYALEGVEGRMTRVDEGQDFDVIVDYAHSPDSFEKLFKDIKPVVKGKLIVLFGSLGGGDKGKRPVQGKLAGQYADEVIITEEDDRTEDPAQIRQDIAAGAEEAGKVRDKDYFIVDDRTEAINFAVKRARKGDTILLLGKGHEKTIEHADGEHPWDETGTARAALKNL